MTLLEAHLLNAPFLLGKRPGSGDFGVGCSWTQQSFPYQGKCLRWINEQYQTLSTEDQGQVDTLLDGTGCEALLTSGL